MATKQPDLDRIAKQLVTTVRARFPQYLTEPFEVAELHQNILPYRHYRRELGLQTNEDYELAMLHLLSGAGDYLVVDDRMRDTLRKELASQNPDPAAFRQFASASVSLSPSALQAFDTGAPAPQTRPSTVTRASSARLSTPGTAPAMPRTTSAVGRVEATIVPNPGDTCRACGEGLPAGRRIGFCPHCGQSLTRMDCPACGSEVEVGWRFCPTCGRPISS